MGNRMNKLESFVGFWGSAILFHFTEENLFWAIFFALAATFYLLCYAYESWVTRSTK